MRPILQRPSGRSRLSHGLRSYCTQGRKQATRAQKLEPIRNCIPVRKHIGTRGLSSWRFPVNSTSGLHDKSTAWHPVSLSLDLQTNPKRLGQTYLPHEQATDLGTLDCSYAGTAGPCHPPSQSGLCPQASAHAHLGGGISAGKPQARAAHLGHGCAVLLMAGGRILAV